MVSVIWLGSSPCHSGHVPFIASWFWSKSSVEARQMFTSRGRGDPEMWLWVDPFKAQESKMQAEILLTVGRLGMCKTDIYTYPIIYIYTYIIYIYIHISYIYICTMIYIDLQGISKSSSVLGYPTWTQPAQAGGPRWVSGICKWLSACQRTSLPDAGVQCHSSRLPDVTRQASSGMTYLDLWDIYTHLCW